MNICKSYVYKFSCNDPNIEEVYIGSSKYNPLFTRLSDHKYNCNCVFSPKYYQHKYKFMRNTGGFDNWVMTILQEYENITNIELLKEEKKYIESFEKVLNKKLPIRS